MFVHNDKNHPFHGMKIKDRKKRRKKEHRLEIFKLNGRLPGLRVHKRKERKNTA